MKYLFAADIIDFAPWMVTINNQKLYIAAFYKLFHLILSFKLPFFNIVQSHFLIFSKLFSNLCKLLALISHNLDAFLAFCTLSFFYHMLIKAKVIGNTIIAALFAFKKNISKVKNKHLHYNA